MADGGWSSLPADLLDQITARLTSDADHLHAHQACAHWRASTSRPAAYRPWIVAGRQAHDDRCPLGSEYALLQLLRGVRRVELPSSPPGLRYCCGTPRGWLALSDHPRSPTRLALWEPHSGTEIPLPPLCPLIQVFLSGDPLASSHWMAVASQLLGPVAHVLFFWRPGDAAWTGPGMPHAVPHAATIHSVEFDAGKMYVIDKKSNIAIYDLKLGTTSPPEFIQASGMYLDEACRLSEAWAGRKFDSIVFSVLAVHVVACGGQLLLAVLFYGRRELFMEVYRPEWTPLWDFRVGERVTDLGGYALFLGRGDALALSAREYPAIKGNCVYYLDHCRDMQTSHWAWAIVFDLGTDATEGIPYPKVEENGGANWCPYSWFCPRMPLLEKQLA
jgi:hypothetical protein